MSEHNVPFRVVVGYDFSSQAHMALERAVWLSGGFDVAEVHAVSAVDWRHHDPMAPEVASTFEGTEELRNRVLNDAETILSEFKPRSIKVFVHTRIGNAADAILEVAGEVRADMILVGTHSKRGVARLFLGSVSERVVREAHCPVIVIRETHYDPDAPGIGPEPPCRRCLEVRRESGGEIWWCDLHDHSPPYPSPLTASYRHDPETSQRFAWPYSR